MGIERIRYRASVMEGRSTVRNDCIRGQLGMGDVEN